MKNNKSIMAVVSVAVVLCVSGCAKQSVKNIDSQGKSIVCFGDSLTMGYGVEPGQDYPSNLAGLLKLPVFNAGIDGDTSTEAMKRLDTDVLSRDPLVVVIEFGGNDFLRKVPLEQTVDNMEAMIQRVQAKGAMVALVDIGTSMIMGDYSKAFKRLSRKYNTIFVPNLMSGIFTNPAMKSDFIHPNMHGYKIIAHRVHRALLPHLNENIVRTGLPSKGK